MMTNLTRPRIVELLDRARRRRVDVVGDAMLNVYMIVAAIGARCDLVAAVGNDQSGRILRDIAYGIGSRASMMIVERCTIQKARAGARFQ